MSGKRIGGRKVTKEISWVSTVWVPELGGEVKSTNIVIDELATGELEQGEVYKNN